MKKWLTTQKYAYQIFLVKYEDSNYKKFNYIKPLTENDGLLSVRFSDILYLSLYDNEDTCRIKYNNHTNYMFSSNDYKSLCEKFCGFYKAIPWFYEKEFRIEIEVNHQIIECINKDDLYKIVITFSDDVFSELNIMIGPEHAKDIDFSEFHGFTKYTNKKIQRSRFNGEIEMRLKDKMCKSCQDNK